MYKENLEIKQKKEVIAIKENNYRIILNRREQKLFCTY